MSSLTAGGSVNWFSQFGKLFGLCVCRLLLKIFEIRWFQFVCLKSKRCKDHVYITISGEFRNRTLLLTHQFFCSETWTVTLMGSLSTFAHFRSVFTAKGLHCKLMGKVVLEFSSAFRIVERGLRSILSKLQMGILYNLAIHLLNPYLSTMGFTFFWVQSIVRNTIHMWPIHPYICRTEIKVPQNSIYRFYRWSLWYLLFDIWYLLFICWVFNMCQAQF